MLEYRHVNQLKCEPSFTFFPRYLTETVENVLKFIIDVKILPIDLNHENSAMCFVTLLGVCRLTVTITLVYRLMDCIALFCQFTEKLTKKTTLEGICIAKISFTRLKYHLMNFCNKWYLMTNYSSKLILLVLCDACLCFYMVKSVFRFVARQPRYRFICQACQIAAE